MWMLSLSFCVLLERGGVCMTEARGPWATLKECTAHKKASAVYLAQLAEENNVKVLFAGVRCTKGKDA